VSTANQDLFDLTLQRQIAVRQYSQDVLGDILHHLTMVDQDLVKKLTGSLTDFQKSRLNSLLKEVIDLRTAIWKELQDTTKLDLTTLAKIEAQWEGQALEKVIPIEYTTASLDLDKIAAVAVAKPFQGATMSQWFSDLAAKDTAAITRAITLGVTEGQTTDEMIRTIRGTAKAKYADGLLAVSRRHAETIVRTATNHVSNQARNQVWEANSDIIRGKRWTATLDGRTSVICASRDGHVAPMGDKPLAPGEQLLSPPDAQPPAHPNCRSLLVAVLDGLGMIGDRPTVTDTRTREKREVDFRKIAKAEGKSIQQVRKEWADANVGSAPAATTYEQWLRTQPAAFQDKVLGATRGGLFRKGTPIGDFVTSTGATKKVMDLTVAKAAPNVRNYIRNELLKGTDQFEVLAKAQAAFPSAGVSTQQVGLLRKAMQNSGVLPGGGEVGVGTTKAAEMLQDFQASLPAHVQAAAPPGWADIIAAVDGFPKGIHTIMDEKGVKFVGPVVGKMAEDRLKATYANGLGHLLRDQSLDPLKSDLVTSIYQHAQGVDLGPLGISGEVLIDELFGLALNPGPVTSWGTSSANILLTFADDIKAIQTLLEKSLGPKGKVPQASHLSFPVTGHATVSSYAKAMISAGHNLDDVLEAVKYNFPDATVTDKSIAAYKAQLAGAKKLADMPPKVEVDAALAEAKLNPTAVLNKMNQLQDGFELMEDASASSKAALTLHKVYGNWAKVEAKLQPKVVLVKTPAPGAVRLTPQEISAAEKGWQALGPTSKKAAEAGVAHVKATGSMKDIEVVLKQVFGDFDPVKGKPLLDLIEKLAGLKQPPWAKAAAEAAEKAAKQAALQAAQAAEKAKALNVGMTPKRPALTPADGHPPPPRFTDEQKRSAVLREFGTVVRSNVKQLNDLEFTVVQKYTGGWYDQINGKLAQGDYASNYQVQALSELAQEAMRKLPAYPGNKLLIRNIQVQSGKMAAFNTRYAVGEIVEETRFTSTSTNGGFGRGSNTQFRITKHKSARDVDYFSLNQGEKEILFAPGARFRVLSVNEQRDNYGNVQRIIEMEEV